MAGNVTKGAGDERHTRVDLGLTGPKSIPKVIVSIRMGRHGEKSEPGQDGLLSLEGELQATDYGRRLPENLPTDETYGVKVYSSGVPRALSHGKLIDRGVQEAIVEGSQRVTKEDSQGRQLLQRKRHELSYEGLMHLPEGGWGRLQQPFLEKHHPDFNLYEPERRKQAMQEAEDYMCDETLKDKDYVGEAAANISHLLSRQIKLAGNLKPGSRAVLVDVSHNGPLMAFLSKCLVVEDTATGASKTGFNSVEEIGGSLKPSEFFEVNVTVNENNKRELGFRFEDTERLKGSKCSLDLAEWQA